MDEKTIDVSVLMSVYNGGEFLSASIESILAQSLRNFEFIIIDDGSTDNSIEIINSFNDPRIKLIKNEKNLGLISSLNKGIDYASGRYIARHDADDIALPERLSKQLKAIKERGLIAIGSWLQLVDEHNNYQQVWQYPLFNSAIHWQLLFNSAFGHSSIMYDKSAVVAAGKYRHEAKYVEDYDLWSRISSAGRMSNIQEALVLYRVHSQAISTIKEAEQDLARADISQKAILDLLNREISVDLRDILTGRTLPKSPNQLAGAVEILNQLKHLIIEKYSTAECDNTALEIKYIEKTLSLFENLTITERIVALGKISSFMSRKFWCSQTPFNALFSAEFKEKIKKILGKQQEKVTRNNK